MCESHFAPLAIHPESGEGILGGVFLIDSYGLRGILDINTLNTTFNITFKITLDITFDMKFDIQSESKAFFSNASMRVRVQMGFVC
jgi:hypothetical protein